MLVLLHSGLSPSQALQQAGPVKGINPGSLQLPSAAVSKKAVAQCSRNPASFRTDTVRGINVCMNKESARHQKNCSEKPETILSCSKD